MKRRKLLTLAALLLATLISGPMHAADNAVEQKVDASTRALQRLAQDPKIIAALKQANEQQPSINNEEWQQLPESDPIVMQYSNNEAAKLLREQNQQDMGKLLLRDRQGNLVAGNRKPAVFNIADRAPFKNAMTGQSWHSSKAIIDPTTKQPSVQVSVPVFSEGQTIGVLHTNVVTE